VKKPWGTVGRERFEGCGGSDGQNKRRHDFHHQFFLNPSKAYICVPTYNCLFLHYPIIPGVGYLFSDSLFVTIPTTTLVSLVGSRFSRCTVDMWNRKLRSFAHIPAPSTFMVRYEDLVDDPAAVVAQLKRQFFDNSRGASGAGSSGGGGGFVNVEGSTKTKKKDYSTYRTYYIEERWKAKFDHPPVLAFINRWIADDVLSDWRYLRWTEGAPLNPTNGGAGAGASAGGKSWMVTPTGGATSGGGGVQNNGGATVHGVRRVAPTKTTSQKAMVVHPMGNKQKKKGKQKQQQFQQRVAWPPPAVAVKS
jgi:hypothetical protein